VDPNCPKPSADLAGNRGIGNTEIPIWPGSGVSAPRPGHRLRGFRGLATLPPQGSLLVGHPPRASGGLGLPSSRSTQHTGRGAEAQRTLASGRRAGPGQFFFCSF
jgi:hypothetical protein